MHVSIIIGGSLIGVGTLLYIHHRLTHKETPDFTPEAATQEPEEEECCGMHITCEKDSLSPVFVEEALYFDDEELDRYANTDSSDYDDEAVEMFREVLFTLKPDEIASWARSIQLRGIALPEAVREELLLIVREERENRLQPERV